VNDSPPPPATGASRVSGSGRVGSPGGGDPGRPYISVIVTAHDRRQYLQGAVESVLGQTLPPEEFEVLVVKFLRDPVLDRWLDAQRPRVRTITDEGLPRLGQKLARGVAQARGSVLCFLEDDDRYLPNKLASVADRFRRDPTMVYYRNRNRCIDASGRPLVGPFSRMSARELTIPPTQRDDLRVVDFMRHYGAEGNSSIAVRRELLLPLLPALEQFSTSTDWILFVGALASSGALVVGPETLSEYRLHDSLSQGATRTSRQRLSAEIARSGEAVVRLTAGSRAERAARFLRGRGSVTWYLLDPAARRPSFGTLRDAAWLAWLRREPTFAIQIGWCALRFFAPRSTTSAYWGYHQRDSQRQNWRVEGVAPATPPSEMPRRGGSPP